MNSPSKLSDLGRGMWEPPALWKLDRSVGTLGSQSLQLVCEVRAVLWDWALKAAEPDPKSGQLVAGVNDGVPGGCLESWRSGRCGDHTFFTGLPGLSCRIHSLLSNSGLRVDFSGKRP